MITFDQPGILLFLAVLPPAMFLTYGWKRRGGLLPLSFTMWERDRFESPLFFHRFLLFLANVSLWLGVASLIVALAGPRLVEREKIYLHRGVDIVFVLDQSPSMIVRDFGGDTRFDTAKHAIRTFVEGREHDPLGLVIFGDEAALVTPPTLDYTSFLSRMDSVRVMKLGRGSALGLGMAVATVHLEKSSAERKVMVIVSDGENNAGEITPESAARVAASLGIRIYAVGVGGEGSVAIEFTDPETGKSYRGTYEGKVDMDLLKTVTESTGGQAFLAGSPGALSQVFREIDALESVELRSTTDISSEPVHHLLIRLGLWLLVFYAFVKRLFFREVL
ncbi:vWA domain-containing protein [Sediminispirochaeta bajacaliforniensis]|uniref:vWA domain-containing protein n=1 Tax=Sediminispirochaeta bajacaliforniensis TaxID=148 RepID=UPI000366D717|nr:VWA domain-containing protein [Sediminispirochaeta bajacaliforniensis]